MKNLYIKSLSVLRKDLVPKMSPPFHTFVEDSIVLWRTFLILTPILMYSLVSLPGAAAASLKQIDPSMIPITNQALTSLISHTPYDSKEQGILISRAYWSHISDVAYEDYTKAWEGDQQNGWLNLLRGDAAENCWLYHFFDQHGSPAQCNVYFNTTETCFKKAAQLLPHNPQVLSSYGYFINQFYLQQSAGLQLVQSALDLAPRNASILDALALILSDEFQPCYNPTRAEALLNEAIDIDPVSADPHFYLMGQYIELKEYQKAQVELNKYLSLCPASMESDYRVVTNEKIIEDGIQHP